MDLSTVCLLAIPLSAIHLWGLLVVVLDTIVLGTIE